MLALPAGGTIVVAAGTYASAIDTQNSLTIKGRCAAMVTLHGPSDQCVLHGGAGASLTISGVTLDGGNEMLRLDSAKASLKRVAIGNGLRYGIKAQGGSQLSISQCFIHDIAPSQPDLSVGQGIAVQGASTLVAADLRISHAHDIGLAIDGVASLATLDRVAIDGTQLSVKTGDSGHGLAVTGGAQGTFTDIALQANHSAAALCYGVGSSFTLKNTWIDGTLPSGPAVKDGSGVLVMAGAQIAIQNARITENHSSGILANGSGTEVNLGAVLISGTQGSAGGLGGEGIIIQGGASASWSVVQLLNNRAEGALIDGAQLTVQDLQVVGTQPQLVDQAGGIGLSVVGGANVTAKGLDLLQNHFAGLFVAGVGTQLLWTDGQIADTSTAAGYGGYGCIVQGGGSAICKGSLRFHHNTAIGVYVTSQGSSLGLAGTVVIDQTQPVDSGSWGGRGLAVEASATATLDGSVLLSENSDAGLFVVSGGQLVSTADFTVAGTLPRADGSGGRGIQVFQGAQATLASTTVIGNAEVGVVVDGPGSALISTGAWRISGTVAAKNTLWGRGLQVSSGATLKGQGEAATLRLSGNSEHGLVVDGLGSLISALPLQFIGNGARGLVVQGAANLQASHVILYGNAKVGLHVDGAGSRVQVDQLGSLAAGNRGAEVSTGAELRADSLLSWQDNGLGVFVHDPGSKAWLLDARIDAPHSLINHTFGHGLQAQAGAELHLAGAAIVQATELAMVANASIFQAIGVWVQAPTVQSAFQAQVGAAVEAGAKAQFSVIASRFEMLQSAAVLVDQASLQLTDTLIRQVAAVPTGKYPDLADAIIANKSILLQLERSWIDSAARYGLSLQGDAATVHASRVQDCAAALATVGASAVAVTASWLTNNAENTKIIEALTLPSLTGVALGLDPVAVQAP